MTDVRPWNERYAHDLPCISQSLPEDQYLPTTNHNMLIKRSPLRLDLPRISVAVTWKAYSLGTSKLARYLLTKTRDPDQYKPLSW